MTHLKESKCIKAAIKLFCEQVRRSGQLCCDPCHLSDAEMGWEGGQGTSSESLMMVQIVHLVKLESDVNSQHVTDQPEPQQQGKCVDLTNISKKKRCKGQTSNNTSLFRKVPLKCLLVMF